MTEKNKDYMGRAVMDDFFSTRIVRKKGDKVVIALPFRDEILSPLLRLTFPFGKSLSYKILLEYIVLYIYIYIYI